MNKLRFRYHERMREAGITVGFGYRQLHIAIQCSTIIQLDIHATYVTDYDLKRMWNSPWEKCKAFPIVSLIQCRMFQVVQLRSEQFVFRKATTVVKFEWLQMYNQARFTTFWCDHRDWFHDDYRFSVETFQIRGARNNNLLIGQVINVPVEVNTVVTSLSKKFKWQSCLQC